MEGCHPAEQKPAQNRHVPEFVFSSMRLTRADEGGRFTAARPPTGGEGGLLTGRSEHGSKPGVPV
tara:strand:+ start:175 stop:369 length:195 start_codon:yes stop_codon:yes gene_type:complete